MAKKSTPVPIVSNKVHAPVVYVTSKEDKREKVNGKVYILTQELAQYGHSKTFKPEVTKFVECNDGNFVIYIDGERTCFRYMPEKINRLMDILKEQ